MGYTRVLITGAGGMLGEAVYQTTSSLYKEVYASDIDLNEPWLHYLDVRDIRAVMTVCEEYKPDLIIHLAALTDLEYCEVNAEEAWKTNALGAENVALAAKKLGATMVHVSTAGVFGGEKEFFHDFDIPNPLSIYGKSKYHAELFVQQQVPNHYVFRAGWMMGGGIKKDKKFVNKVYQQLARGAKELFVVDDKLGTPTYTHDFSKNMSRVIDTGFYGLYNQVCGGSCSRYDVALELVRLWGVQDSVTVTKVSSDHFKQEYFAPRPESEKLVNLKLSKRDLNFMRDWKECLTEYAVQFPPLARP